MGQFIVVLLVVCAFTAYFFDVDTALWAGKRTVEFYLVAGLVLAVLSPLVEIFRFVTFIVQKVYHVFHRGNV